MAEIDASDARQIVDRRWSAWMASAQGGDRAAYEALLRECVPLVQRVARGQGVRGPQVDDVVQDTFLVAWRKLPSLADLSAVRGWLIRIASRQAFDRLRARHATVDLAEHEPFAAEHREPARVVEAGTKVDALRVALGQLSEGQRQCWILREVAGYSYEDIADELSVPVSTVRGLLARARRTLAVQMEGWR